MAESIAGSTTGSGGPGGGGGALSMMVEEESPLNSTINTTPLVDIMLVMLIIFLITVPVAVSVVPVTIPEEENQAVVMRPENMSVSVDARGEVFIGMVRVPDEDYLLARFREAAVLVPQPEVHIRGDLNTEYLNVGKVVESAQRAGIMKIGFITKAPPREL